MHHAGIAVHRSKGNPSIGLDDQRTSNDLALASQHVRFYDVEEGEPVVDVGVTAVLGVECSEARVPPINEPAVNRGCGEVLTRSSVSLRVGCSVLWEVGAEDVVYSLPTSDFFAGQPLQERAELLLKLVTQLVVGGAGIEEVVQPTKLSRPLLDQCSADKLTGVKTNDRPVLFDGKFKLDRL